ncbi:MAG: BlaI/MecI/CopY family transcriptional regulator [Acidobacteriota bacterium]
MARKKSPTLTEAELRLMEVLWKKGAATVGDVVDSLPKKKAVAYNTVLTILRILEQKGYVRHTKEGRAFIYHPVIGRREACRNAVSYVVSRFFQNSPELLVLNMLEDGKIDEDEIKRLRKMLEE